MAAAAGLVLLLLALPAAADEPSAPRRQELVRLVRQDCGACHGLRLSGGLGPALTPQALARRSDAELAATILHGRPGTAMPPWKSLLDEREALWIARRLQTGLPAQ